MGETTWTAYTGPTSYLTTELNTLANNGNKLGAAIDNSSNRDWYIDIEVCLASVDLSAQTNPAIYIWLLPRTDGTNFEDGGDSVNPARSPDDIIPLREVNGAQRVFSRLLALTPDQSKILIGNRAGAALAGTLNTVKHNIYGPTTA